MNNHQLNLFIKKQISKYAEELKIPFKRILVSPLKKEMFNDKEATYYMKYYNNEIKLFFNPNFFAKMKMKTIKIMMVHELCHCKDRKEGLYKDEWWNVDNPILNQALYDMFQSYSNFLAYKRQTKLMDWADIVNVLTIGLDKRLNKINMTLTLDTKDAVIKILNIVHECVIYKIVGYETDLIPKTLFQVADLIIDDFNYIKDLRVDWETRSSLIFCETMLLTKYVQLINTYKSNFTHITKKVDENALRDNIYELIPINKEEVRIYALLLLQRFQGRFKVIDAVL